MPEILENILLAAIPSMLGYVIWILKEQRKEDKAKKDATKCLLRVQLIEYYEKYQDHESVPAYVFDNWSEMFKDYQELGGNGTVAQMNHSFMKHTIEHGGFHHGD